MKSGEGETGEEDTREDNDEGAPEEAAPRNDVALFLTAILHGWGRCWSQRPLLNPCFSFITRNLDIYLWDSILFFLLLLLLFFFLCFILRMI